MWPSRAISVYSHLPERSGSPGCSPILRVEPLEENSLRTGTHGVARLQRGLDHLKADRGYLLQPISLLTAFRTRVSGLPCIQQRKCESHLGYRTAFLQPEHLVVDLIFDPLTAIVPRIAFSRCHGSFPS